MNIIEIEGHKFAKALDCSDIDRRIKELAQQIKADNKPDTLYICMLNGGALFTFAVMMEMGVPNEMAFVKWSSYRGNESTGNITEEMPLTTPVKGRDIVVLEDIIDTGNTMTKFKEYLQSKGAKSCKIAVLLNMRGKRKFDIEPDYVGFEMTGGFVVGHGFEYDNKGRGLRDIYQEYYVSN
ncbi:MAG: hypoxanthine phosphoribosyltransferase [Paludibacteraceae bacterium]|nr:hypoxanthine phosphoribosyltransferase [Paludibacteraceae bacterium]